MSSDRAETLYTWLAGIRQILAEHLDCGDAFDVAVPLGFARYLPRIAARRRESIGEAFDRLLTNEGKGPGGTESPAYLELVVEKIETEGMAWLRDGLAQQDLSDGQREKLIGQIEQKLDSIQDELGLGERPDCGFIQKIFVTPPQKSERACQIALAILQSLTLRNGDPLVPILRFWGLSMWAQIPDEPLVVKWRECAVMLAAQSDPDSQRRIASRVKRWHTRTVKKLGKAKAAVLGPSDAKGRELSQRYSDPKKLGKITKPVLISMLEEIFDVDNCRSLSKKELTELTAEKFNGL